MIFKNLPYIGMEECSLTNLGKLEEKRRSVKLSNDLKQMNGGSTVAVNVINLDPELTNNVSLL